MTQREAFIWYAERFIGRPYIWGGDDPMAGFDCSGLIVEAGMAVGLYTADDTARGLYARGKIVAAPASPGDLVFWGTRVGDSQSIEHVEILWDKAGGMWLSLGAGGGGSKILTLADAIAANAFVRIRPVRPGSRHLFFSDPFSVQSRSPD
jgi:cell wall-associated NlpC family hydrolase